MFNPLQLFHIRYLEAFRKKGVQAFVLQAYERGKMSGEEKPTYVAIHFERILAARQYYDVLKDEPVRDIFFIDNRNDRERLEKFLETGDVYMMLKIKDAEAKARKILDKKIKAYIDRVLKWAPSRQDEVQFSLDVQFGQVYGCLKFRAKEIKVKLADIESAHYVL